MMWTDRIADARKTLVATAARAEHKIRGALADEHDIDQRIAQMRAIACAYLALMTALIDDLNDALPVTDKVPLKDFQDAVSDASEDASGAFRRAADRMISSRPVGRRAHTHHLAAKRAS